MIMIIIIIIIIIIIAFIIRFKFFFLFIGREHTTANERTQQLPPTLLAQQCWELLRPFACSFRPSLVQTNVEVSMRRTKLSELSPWNVRGLAQFGSFERVWIVQHVLSFCFRWIERPKIVSGTNGRSPHATY